MKHLLTLQDLSCVGRCSLTVALPVLSALGVRCSVLPTAVLSTHTAFPKPEVVGLTESLAPFAAHWRENGIGFDGVTVGYLENPGQARAVEQVLDILEAPLTVFDPVMGDNGRLYSRITPDHIDALRSLCGRAEVVVPNLTEALALTGQNMGHCEPVTEVTGVAIPSVLPVIAKERSDCGNPLRNLGQLYRPYLNSLGIATPACGLVRNDRLYDGDCHDQSADWSDNDLELEALADGVLALGAKAVVITGVPGDASVGFFGKTARGEVFSWQGPLIDRSCHGTGDIFAAVLAGCLARGMALSKACENGAVFVVKCLEATPEATPHGVEFEGQLGWLTGL